jgi:hypothetical protein
MTKPKLGMNTTGERIVTVDTWSGLQEALFEGSWNQRIRRHRSPHLFRGHGRADFELASGLVRHGESHSKLEKHLLRNFKKYAKSHFRADEHQPDNFWHWMTLAQHHGLPTRLLDWTYSPLIAAHFACSEQANFDQNGAIWKVDFDGTHDLLSMNLRRHLADQGAHVFTDDMLSNEIDTLEKLAEHDQDSDGQVLFFEPPSVSARIVNQFACFSVQTGRCQSMTEWLQHHPELWTKIIIPHELKWEIRDKLDQSNISERVLFPGLDGLCSWLARQYTPRR